MKMNRLIYTVVTAFALQGCATAAKFDEKCRGWLGKSETDLVASVGVPTNVYTVGDDKFIEYQWDQTTSIEKKPWSFTNRPEDYQVVNHGCTATFTVSQNTIVRYAWHGTCRSK